jgi:hypothetical protein
MRRNYLPGRIGSDGSRQARRFGCDKEKHNPEELEATKPKTFQEVVANYVERYRKEAPSPNPIGLSDPPDCTQRREDEA